MTYLLAIYADDDPYTLNLDDPEDGDEASFRERHEAALIFVYAETFMLDGTLVAALERDNL